MYTPKYPLETARLFIRPLTEADLDDVYAYHQLPEATAYLPWPERSREATREVLVARQLTVSLEGEGSSLALGAALRETNQVIGEMFLFWRSEPNRQGELGFVFHPAFQGRGYAQEAAECMLTIGFGAMNWHRIFGRCDSRNAASARLMSRLGMRQEAHFIGNQLFKGEWNEELVFAILRQEWVARQSGQWAA
jgi:RimJ/RimL family protein N-acetyltransferase